MLPVLWPLLYSFCARHPDVEPDVQLDDRIGDWVRDGIDVGFRAGSPPGDGVNARHLLPLQLIVCARGGRLVPLLTAHVAEHLGLYLYYGSRVAQPARVRAFIDWVVERLDTMGAEPARARGSRQAAQAAALTGCTVRTSPPRAVSSQAMRWR